MRLGLIVFIIVFVFAFVSYGNECASTPMKVSHRLSNKPNLYEQPGYVPSQPQAAFPERLLPEIRSYTVGITDLADDRQTPLENGIAFLPGGHGSYGIHYRRAGAICHRNGMIKLRLEIMTLATTHFGLRVGEKIIDLQNHPSKTMRVFPGQVSWQFEHTASNVLMEIDVVCPASVPAYGYLARIKVRNNSNEKLKLDLIQWTNSGATASKSELGSEQKENSFLTIASDQKNPLLPKYITDVEAHLYLHDTNYNVLSGFDQDCHSIGTNAIIKPLSLNAKEEQTVYSIVIIDSPGYETAKIEKQVSDYFAKNPKLTQANQKRMTKDALETYANIIVDGDKKFEAIRTNAKNIFENSLALNKKGIYRSQAVSFDLPDKKMQAMANMVGNDWFPGLFQPPGFVHDAKYGDFWNYIFCYRHVHAASDLGLEQQAMDYLRVLSANQLENGRISSIRANFATPAHPTQFDASYIDALYHYYKWTGDIDSVREVWDVIVRAAEYLDQKLDPDGDLLYKDFFLQWKSDFDCRGPSSSFQTAIVWKAYSDLAEFAKILGKDEQARTYAKKASDIRKAAQEKLWSDKYAIFGPRGPMDMLRLHPQSLEVEIPVWTKFLDPYQSYIMTDWFFANNAVEDSLGHIWMTHTDWWPAVWSQHVPAPGDYMMVGWARMLTGQFDDGFRCLQAVASGSTRSDRPGFNYMFDQFGRQGGGDPATAQGAWTRALVEGVYGIVPHVDENYFELTPRLPKNEGKYSYDRPGLQIEYDFSQTKKQVTVKTSQNVHAKLRIPVQGIIEKVTLDCIPVDYTIERSISHGLVIVDTKNSGGKVIVEVQPKEWEILAPSSVKLNDTIDIVLEGIDKYTIDDRFNFFEFIKKESNKLQLKLKKEACGRASVFLHCTKGNLTWTEPVSFWTMRRKLVEKRQRTVCDSVAENARFLPLDLSEAYTDDIQSYSDHKFKTDSADSPFDKIQYWTMPFLELTETIPKEIKVQGVPFILGAMGPGEAEKEKDLIMLCNTPPYSMNTGVSFEMEPKQLQKIYLLSLNMNFPQKCYLPAATVTIQYMDGSTEVTELIPPYNFDCFYQDFGINTVAFPLPYKEIYGEGRWHAPMNYKLDQMHLTMTDVICDPSKEVKTIEIKSIATETFMGIAGITAVQK